MTTLSTHIFWLAKAGNTAAEYEDAFHGKSSGCPPRAIVAIADGATESLLSRNWANLLTKRFVRHWEQAANPSEWLAETIQTWQYDKREYLRRRERSSNPVQWYEEPGLEAGAFAALLGFQLSMLDQPAANAADTMLWNATAIGDCCLFQIRGDDFICAFPLNESVGFNNRPFLLSSNPARNGDVVQRIASAGGKARQGDRFYLLTDALAAWFLRTYEQGEYPWQELDEFARANAAQADNTAPPENPAFTAWIEAQREAHRLRNDDVTLIRIEILD